MPKHLTVEKLGKLRWTFVVHLNMGTTHSMAYENKIWGLHYSRETKEPDKKIIGCNMTASKLPDYVCDLLAKDRDAELERFVEEYNNA